MQITLPSPESMVIVFLLPCVDSALTRPLQTRVPSELSLQLLLTLPYAEFMVNGLRLPCAERQHVHVRCRLGYLTNWLSQSTLSTRLHLKIKEDAIQPPVTMNHSPGL